MPKVDQSISAGLIAHLLRSVSSEKKFWNIRCLPVCASTETSISQWINDQPFCDKRPRALFADRQHFGQGQRGRVWYSPKGGIWCSAAIPLFLEKHSTGIFGLAVAVALAKRLENSGISLQIKWPNDLLVKNKKVAGFLPRLVYRGSSLKMARIGIGLNVYNNVPIE